MQPSPVGACISFRMFVALRSFPRGLSQEVRDLSGVLAICLTWRILDILVIWFAKSIRRMLLYKKGREGTLGQTYLSRDALTSLFLKCFALLFANQIFGNIINCRHGVIVKRRTNPFATSGTGRLAKNSCKA